MPSNMPREVAITNDSIRSVTNKIKLILYYCSKKWILKLKKSGRTSPLTKLSKSTKEM
jgi:hypothetical protein